MKRQPNINLLTPQQQQYLSGTLSPQISELSSQAYQKFLQPDSSYEDVFQKSILEPTMMDYQRQILPAIHERFLGGDEKESGALNQALAQSATDLSTALGGQRANLYGQQQSNRMNALGSLGGLATQQTFQPVMEQKGGILPSLLQSLGVFGGGSLFR